MTVCSKFLLKEPSYEKGSELLRVSMQDQTEDSHLRHDEDLNPDEMNAEMKQDFADDVPISRVAEEQGGEDLVADGINRPE